jgi:periplasmic divalent cation tolerance protein
MKSDSYVVVFITAPNEESAHDIGELLVEKKIAACVNLIPHVCSIFTWGDESTAENEVLMIVKTTARLFRNKLIKTVKSVHPYDVPEIIALPMVDGDKAYLDWMDEVME